jgi:putative ABC transport system permease protein
MGLACLAGALAGFVTAFVSVRFHILHLLASILTMIALFSVNLRIMGRPNIAVLNKETVLTPFYGLGLQAYLVRPLFVLVVAAAVAVLLALFLRTDLGLAMRATGANPRMARAQGIRVGALIMTGVALSNALVALAGAFFAQTNGFADVTSGVGTIVVGLAAVIVGETLLPRGGMFVAVGACLLGSVLYRLAVQLALSLDFLGLTPSDLNLATAVLVLLTLIMPRFRQRRTIA